MIEKLKIAIVILTTPLVIAAIVIVTLFAILTAGTEEP